MSIELQNQLQQIFNAPTCSVLYIESDHDGTHEVFKVISDGIPYIVKILKAIDLTP